MSPHDIILSETGPQAAGKGLANFLAQSLYLRLEMILSFGEIRREKGDLKEKRGQRTDK